MKIVIQASAPPALKGVRVIAPSSKLDNCLDGPSTILIVPASRGHCPNASPTQGILLNSDCRRIRGMWSSLAAANSEHIYLLISNNRNVFLALSYERDTCRAFSWKWNLNREARERQNLARISAELDLGKLSPVCSSSRSTRCRPTRRPVWWVSTVRSATLSHRVY